MKKLMLLAIAALSVSVAQAVTTAWTSSSAMWSTSGSTSTSSLGTTYYAGNDYSVVVSLIVPTLPTSDNTVLFKVGNSTSANYVSLELTSTGSLILTAKGRTSGALTSITLAENVTAGSTVKAGWAFDRDGDNSATSTIAAYYNGTAIATALTTTDWNGPSNYAYTEVLSSNNLTSATVYSGLLTTAEGTSYTLVPEPTALALLALGVAGLALKRRAA